MEVITDKILSEKIVKKFLQKKLSSGLNTRRYKGFSEIYTPSGTRLMWITCG